MDGPFARLKGALRRRPAAPPLDSATLPEGAADYLRPDNPHLIDLRTRYARCDPKVVTPDRWTSDRLSARDMLYFRGDNHFIWQRRGPNRAALNYALDYYELKARGDDGLIDLLGEDGAFGAMTFTIDGRTVSRDLLDSAREIQFLRHHSVLGDGQATILDIGAGYGRLAWRIEQASSEDVRVFATDAFAPSTFIAEYYLRHRGAGRASVVALDRVDGLLASEKIDLALNVHSFSECTPEAVVWWIEKLARHEVRQLMVVPNEGGCGGERCRFNDGGEMEPIFARFGYRIAVRASHYDDPIVHRFGIDPTWLHLFELR